MEIIHALAETLNFFTIHVTLLLQKFLQLNFTFVSFILKFLQDLKEALLDYILPILNILGCYYQDLIIFIYEVIDIIQLLINTVVNILHSAYTKIIYVINNFTDFIYDICQNVSYCFISVYKCALQVYDLIVYLIQLFFDSTLLILQLLPNLLIFLFDVSKICFYYLIELLVNSASSFIVNICYASSSCIEAIYNIPIKAYIGALLLALLFHQYRTVLKYLKAYFALLILLLLEVGNYIIYVVFICLKPVAEITVTTFRTLKRILFSDASRNSNCSGIRNTWLVQTYNFFQRYIRRIKNFLKKYLIRGKHAEEQIENLQKELLAEREKHICIICFDRPRSIIIHPCRHMCICEECSSNWYTNLQRCPLCRQTILDVYSVYT